MASVISIRRKANLDVRESQLTLSCSVTSGFGNTDKNALFFIPNRFKMIVASNKRFPVSLNLFFDAKDCLIQRKENENLISAKNISNLFTNEFCHNYTKLVMLT